MSCDSCQPTMVELYSSELERIDMELCGSVGRSLDLGLKGLKFKTQFRRSHFVVYLSKTLYPLLSTVSTQDDRKLS